MNIGIFTDTYFPVINGVSTSISMLSKELELRGHKVYIFTSTNPSITKAEKNVIRLPSLPLYFINKSQRMTVIYPPQLLFGMKKYDLDIVHTQTEFTMGIFGKIVAKFYKKPLVHTYHTMYEDYVHYIAKGYLITPGMAQSFSRFFCNSSDCVIVPVNKTKKSLLNYGVKKNIEIIPTGIDFEPFRCSNHEKSEINSIKKEIGINENDKVLLNVGRIAKEKSIDVILKKMPEVIDKLPNIKFVIVGDGPFLNELKQMAANLNILDNVKFLGPKPWSEIGKYYQLGDAFISASTSETQGLTYIEAMAGNIPVIAKRDESVEGVVIDNITGFYFEDENDLVETIINAMSNDEKLKEISVNAFENIQELSSHNFALRMENLYNHVVSNFDNSRKTKKPFPVMPSFFKKNRSKEHEKQKK